MKNVNVNRALLGSVATAGFIFVVMAVCNNVFLGPDWKVWTKSAAKIIQSPGHANAMVLWALASVIYGMAGMWIYAGIRSRYGAGPKTAFWAGLLLWMVGWLATALDRLALGALPLKITLVNLGAGYIAAVVGVLIGAWIYKERG